MSNQENWSNNGKRVFLCLFSVAAYIIPHFFNWQKTSLWHLLEYLEGFQNFAASTTGWVSCWNHPWNVDFSVHRICHCHLAGFRQCHDMTSLVHKNKLPGHTEPQKTIGFRFVAGVRPSSERDIPSQLLPGRRSFNGLVEGEKYRTPGSLHTIRAPQGFPVTLPEKILGLLGGFSILACPTEKYRIDHQGLKIRHGVENWTAKRRHNQSTTQVGS